jgi:hypothetical protein
MDRPFYRSTERGKKENSGSLHSQGGGKGAKKSSSMDWLLYKRCAGQGKEEACEGVYNQMGSKDNGSNDDDDDEDGDGDVDDDVDGGGDDSGGSDGDDCDECQDKEGGIYGLGSDQIIAILEYLPVTSVIAFGMTSRRFRAIANSDTVWSLICRREWGSKTVDSWPYLGVNTTGFRWKELYRKMQALGSITWHRLHQGDTLPLPRASHSMATLSNSFVIFGGGQDGGKKLQP